MRPVFENFEDFVKNSFFIFEDKNKRKNKDKEEDPDKSEDYKNSSSAGKYYYDQSKDQFVKISGEINPPGKIFEIPEEELLKMQKDSDLDKELEKETISAGTELGKKILTDALDKLNKEDNELADSILNPLIESAGKTVLGKNIINIKGNSHLQAILKELGFLKSKSGPLKNGITCYFNGETQKALNSLSGINRIDLSNPNDILIFKEALIDSGKLYNKNFAKNILDVKEKSLKAKKPELKPYIDTGLTLPYYDKQWKEEGSFDYKLKLTGDIIKDMYIFNSKKEGGLSDDTRDTGPAKDPCPYEFDAKTGTLNFEGKEYKLAINPHLKDSVSSITGTSKSNKWHTSRGTIWPTWKSTAALLGITSPLEVAKGFFEMTDDNARKVYELTFYGKNVKDKGLETISPLVNHCIGTSMWGSLVHGEKTIANTLKTLKEYGYSSLNDAIEKVGEKFVTELMLLEQIKLYSSYKNANTYITGWTNGILNFHRYFVPKYADLPPKEEFPKEYAKREGEGENGYSNLDVA
jgi:hypothetical protein